jgi:hypothetical protein
VKLDVNVCFCERFHPGVRMRVIAVNERSVDIKEKSLRPVGVVHRTEPRN